LILVTSVVVFWHTAPPTANAQTRVGALTLKPGENNLSSAVIDATNGFAYFGTVTSPGMVVKVKLADFSRVGALTLNPGEDLLQSAVIDAAKGFAYFGTDTFPGIVVKVNVAAVVGQQKVVVLLMKFQDIAYTPNTPSHYSDLIFGSMNAYYVENSFNQFSITGSVFGWYVLPHPRSYYVDSSGSGNAVEMLKDSVATADPYVDFREFKHIIMVFNGLFTPGGAPGWNVQTAEGVVNVGVVFVPDINAETDPDPMGCYAHEFGHALGVPHSDSGHWDCMSGGPELGCYNGPSCSYPAHFISFGKIQLGWLPSSRVNVVSGGQTTFDVFKLEAATTGYQAAKIPVSSTAYYLIETRKQVGYDAYLPGQGVLISYVDETQGNPSSLIDANRSTSTLDDAAWQVGQTYTDTVNRISVAVLRSSADSYTISITMIALGLTNWPGLFTGRAVLQVIGSGAPHGPYNDYAKVDDTLAIVDVVGAPGYSPGAGTLTRFDTEVITETGPPWAWSWKTGYTTQDVIGVGGPVVSSLHRMYNTLSIAPCIWDYATWEIICKDGSRFSDPGGRHGYIALFTDGDRRILMVSGYSAFVTRGLGVMLRNPTVYSSILQGQAVIVKLTDNNGNGIWEVGESVEVLKTVRLASVGVNSTWATSIVGTAPRRLSGAVMLAANMNEYVLLSEQHETIQSNTS